MCGKKMRIKLFESFSLKEQVLQEVNDVLVDLLDLNFEIVSDVDIKTTEKVLNICIKRDVPNSDDGDEDSPNFNVDEIYEPLALLTEWMKEKYSAELVDEKRKYYLQFTNKLYQRLDADKFNLYRNIDYLYIKYVW
jgi:hypothetical protein